MAAIVRVSGERVQRLSDGWELAAVAPGAAAAPAELSRLRPRFVPAQVPGTVAQALYGSLEASVRAGVDLDASDFWYRTRFVQPAGSAWLRFRGLATPADVFLNQEPLFFANNMFRVHEHEIRADAARHQELAIRFRALRAEPRAPRPRYKAHFVADQSLRRVRTTLFGRMPGFTPPVAPVGPYRAVELVERGELRIESADARARVDGPSGVVTVSLVVHSASPVNGKLVVAGASSPIQKIRCDGQRWFLSGELLLPRVERWWPHTHGAQPLYPISVQLESEGRVTDVDLGRTGFRSLELRQDDGGFDLVVNGVSIFCRGACWLPLDVLSLDGSAEQVEATLLLAQRSGMNMLRVAANGIYPERRFYERCDELGLLVWQDFAFARLDYPDDPEFSDNVENEARQLLDATQLCPSLAVLCGNSEVEQQVAMLGLSTEDHQSGIFHRLLPGCCRELRPDVPYWRSTPSGGTLPFHVDRGTSHYFGVGCYRRDPSDARRSDVRFATECLAFSNVPDRSTVAAVLDDDGPGQLRWKAGVARDRGASWDFEDVRDDYLERCFGVHARALRAEDPERWLELGRMVTGELMAGTIAEWRRAGSRCRGALIWHLRDFVPGAGCGLIDAYGRPKAAYFYVARAFQPIAVFVTDEGLNGLRAHVLNDTSRPVAAELSVALYRDGRLPIGGGRTSVALSPRSLVELSVDALLGGFADTAYAYRFGPPGHDVVALRLSDVTSGKVLAEARHLPLGFASRHQGSVDLRAVARAHPSGYVVEVSSDAFVQAVHIEAEGFLPNDDYFHLEPGHEKRVLLSAHGAEPRRPLAVRISAVDRGSALTLNACEEARSA